MKTRSIVKNIITSAALSALVSCYVYGQPTNTLWESSFWKNKPDVASVKAEIAKGNSATALNPNAFDATIMAINNEAPDETIKFLLDLEGNGPDKITHDSRIYLHWAANRGNVAIVEYLLAKKSDVNVEDSHGYKPLPFAAVGGQANPALYDVFFKAGVNPKQRYKDGATILLLSVANDKDLKLSEYFVSKGMSWKDVDDQGSTAFDYAARSGNIDLLKALLQKGVKPTGNALLMAAQGTRRATTPIEVYRYLVEELKINASVTSKSGETILHTIVRKPGQVDIINYFLSKGVDVNKADADGNTSLMVASAGRELANVELLLSKVKNINAVNAKGESALTFAIRGGSSEIVHALLAKGADATVKDKEGNSLASYLVQSYRPQPANGAQQDDFAIKLKALQDKGVDFKAAQKDGNTLYHLAVAKNDLGLLKRLEPLGIDVNAKNKEGITALHRAAMVSKDDAVLKYLLSIGAKKEIKTEFDETAYALAKENEFLTKGNVSVEFLK